MVKLTVRSFYHEAQVPLGTRVLPPVASEQKCSQSSAIVLDPMIAFNHEDQVIARTGVAAMAAHTTLNVRRRNLRGAKLNVMINETQTENTACV